jgi:hypothetical protein
MLIQSCSKVVPVEFSSEGGTFTLFFKPISVAEKARVGQLAQSLTGESPNPFDVLNFTKEIIRSSLVHCEGLETEDGVFTIEVKGGRVTDDCLDDVLNLPVTDKLMLISMQLLMGLPSEGVIMHPVSKGPIEGIVVKKRVMLAR